MKTVKDIMVDNFPLLRALTLDRKLAKQYSTNLSLSDSSFFYNNCVIKGGYTFEDVYAELLASLFVSSGDLDSIVMEKSPYKFSSYSCYLALSISDKIDLTYKDSKKRFSTKFEYVYYRSYSNVASYDTYKNCMSIKDETLIINKHTCNSIFDKFYDIISNFIKDINHNTKSIHNEFDISGNSSIFMQYFSLISVHLETNKFKKFYEIIKNILVDTINLSSSSPIYHSVKHFNLILPSITFNNNDDITELYIDILKYINTFDLLDSERRKLYGIYANYSFLMSQYNNIKNIEGLLYSDNMSSTSIYLFIVLSILNNYDLSKFEFNEELRNLIKFKYNYKNDKYISDATYPYCPHETMKIIILVLQNFLYNKYNSDKDTQYVIDIVEGIQSLENKFIDIINELKYENELKEPPTNEQVSLILYNYPQVRVFSELASLILYFLNYEVYKSNKE